MWVTNKKFKILAENNSSLYLIFVSTSLTIFKSKFIIYQLDISRSPSIILLKNKLNSIYQARDIVETTTTDWTSRNRLSVYEALYLLSIRKFDEATTLLIDCLPTFECYELLDFGKLIFEFKFRHTYNNLWWHHLLSLWTRNKSNCSFTSREVSFLSFLFAVGVNDVP